MRIKNLLYALLALPLVFAACEKDKVDEVKDPTVTAVADEATENAVSFTVTSTESERVAWIVVEATATAPTATEVFAGGTEVEANKTVEVTATDLKAETEYLVVAAAMNKKAAVKSEVKMTTLKGADDPNDGPNDNPNDNPTKEPVLTLTSEATVNVAAAGGEFEIAYTLENAKEGVELTATCEAAWVSVTAGDKVKVVVAANDGAARQAKVVVAYDAQSFEVAVEQAAKEQGENPVTPDVEFTATNIDAWYENNEGKHNYFVVLADKGWGSNGWGVDGGTYYNFDLYSSVANNGVVPNGTYVFDTTNGHGPLTVTEEASYGYKMISVSEAKMDQFPYADAIVIVSDNKIEATVELMNGDIHHIVYEGSLRFEGEPEDPKDPEVFEATHTANQWLWGGSSNYGNKYSVAGEGFSLDVHFPAQYATAEGLAAGEYIWTNTSWWGYNEFENEFTTHEFYVRDYDGVMIYSEIIDSGKALVEKEGEEYHIQITLNGRGGTVYMIEYTGAITKPTVGGGEGDETINFTSMSEGEKQGDYNLKYALKDESGENKVTLVLEKGLADVASITAGTYSWVGSPSDIYGTDFSFVNETLYIAGTQYANKQVSAGTCTVAVEGGVYTITINVTVLGVEKTLKYVGAIGQQGSGNEGGEGTQLTKLATPSVKGLADGNAATVSWQVVEGAKDYTVTLNGTDVQTVTAAYIVYNNLAYSTTYNVSVVANPADATVHSASDAGTATFTTGADPNAGGDEGGNEGGNEGGDEGGNEGGSSNATLKFVKDLSSEYGAGYEMYCYYELTSGSDVVGFYIFNNKSDKKSLYDGTYTHSATGLNGVAYNPASQIYIEKVVIDGVDNGGAQASSTLVVTNSGANVELSLDYNVIGEGVKNRKYVFAGSIE